MRIIISGAAAAWDLETGAEITASARLRALEGLLGDRRCAEYFDDAPLVESGITGGTFRCRYEAASGALRILAEYDAPQALTPLELEALVRETVAQWTDGLGEGVLETNGARIEPLPRDRERSIQVEQLDVAAPVRRQGAPARLHAAARDGDLERIERALSQGEALDAPGQYGLTPLHWAVRSGHLEAVRLLLTRAASPNVRDETAMTPLAAASALGHVALVRLLLDHGADVNGRLRPDEETVDAAPLLLACSRRQVEIGGLLLDRGADPNLRDTSGYTPLAMLTAADEEFGRLLIERGANPRPGKWLRKVKPGLLRKLGL
jgi:hypothetical protein